MVKLIKFTRRFCLFFVYAPMIIWVSRMMWEFITVVLLNNLKFHWLIVLACCFAFLYAAISFPKDKTNSDPKDDEPIID